MAMKPESLMLMACDLPHKVLKLKGFGFATTLRSGTNGRKIGYMRVKMGKKVPGLAYGKSLDGTYDRRSEGK